VRDIAGKETFRKAYRFLYELKEINLRGSKGSFETCSVCNNLTDALKSTKLRWTSEQLKIPLKLYRLHINQQAKEREDLERRIMLAKSQYDSNGNPKYAVLFADGYTEYMGLTPKDGIRPKKGDDKHVGNRCIGIRVVCGSIDTHFLYHTDDLVSGGANIMIEISIRQGLFVFQL